MREAARLEALAYVHNLSAMYPELRPEQADVIEFAERVAADADDDDGIAFGAIEEGVELLDAREQHRLVDVYAGMHPRRWQRMCDDVGSASTAERALAASAVRGAIGERLPPPRELLEQFEEDETIEDRLAAAAFLLPPHLVWSIDAAEEALDAVGKHAHLEPLPSADDDVRFHTVVGRVAVRHWTGKHAERIVHGVDRLAEGAEAASCVRVAGLLGDAADGAAGEPVFLVVLSRSLLERYAVELAVTPPEPLFCPN